MGHGVVMSQGARGSIVQTWNSTPGPSRTRCRKWGWGGRGRALALPLPPGWGREGDLIPPPLPLKSDMALPGLVPGLFSTILLIIPGAPALPCCTIGVGREISDLSPFF